MGYGGETQVVQVNSGVSRVEFEEVSAQLADIAKVFKTATAIGMVDGDPSKAVDNYNALNAFINGGTGRVLFLNGGKFWISQKLVMTQANTAIIGNNRGKNINISCLCGNFADTILEISIPAGANGSYASGISLEGNGVATCGLDMKSGNFYDALTSHVFVNGINGDGVRMGENCYGAKYYNVYTSLSCVCGLNIESAGNQQAIFRDCSFMGSSKGAVLGTDDDIKEALRCAKFDNCDFVSPGMPLTFYKSGYGLEFNRCWIERDGSGALQNELIVLGSANVKAAGIDFINCTYIGNNKSNYVFSWVKAGAINFIGNNKVVTIVTGFIDASTASSYVSDSTLVCNTGSLTSAANLVNGLKINQLFKICCYDSASANFHWKNTFEVDMDGGVSGAGNAKVLNAKRNSEVAERMYLSESGLAFGDGASAVDAGIYRMAANVMGCYAGDSFKLDGTWNGGTLRLGNYYLWVDATGDLRIKNSAPSSDTDGTVVGAQT